MNYFRDVFWRRGLCGGMVAVSLLTGCAAPRETSRTVTIELPGDPEAAQSWFGQGLEALDQQDVALAESCFARALEADAGHGPAHNNLGKLHYLQGDLQSAAMSFRIAADLMPYRPEPANNLGLVLETGNRIDDAVDYYRSALNLAPDHPEYRGNLARAKVRRGDDDQTLRTLLQEIARVDPREAWSTWAEHQLARLKNEDQPSPSKIRDPYEEPSSVR